MALPPHAAEWMDRAEIDYIGPFVKAWAAFNAWYREASGRHREREMLEYVKTAPNPVRLGVLPLLRDHNQTAAALTLKQAVYDLHQGLDAIHLEVPGRDGNERISFREVCIRRKNFQSEKLTSHGQEFLAEKVQGGGIEITVTSVQTGVRGFQYSQDRYDPDEMYGSPGFQILSAARQRCLRQLYNACNPRPMYDLVQGDGPPLAIATMQLQCTAEDLLSGLIEIVYAMRNALLHGVVGPDKRILSCYEPAYRIVMRFLACI